MESTIALPQAKEGSDFSYTQTPTMSENQSAEKASGNTLLEDTTSRNARIDSWAFAASSDDQHPHAISNAVATDVESAKPAQFRAPSTESRGLSVSKKMIFEIRCVFQSHVTESSQFVSWFLVVISTLSSILLYALDNTITADVIPVRPHIKAYHGISSQRLLSRLWLPTSERATDSLGSLLGKLVVYTKKFF